MADRYTGKCLYGEAHHWDLTLDRTAEGTVTRYVCRKCEARKVVPEPRAGTSWKPPAHVQRTRKPKDPLGPERDWRGQRI